PTATTPIYPLSLHDALPISGRTTPPAGFSLRQSFCHTNVTVIFLSLHRVVLTFAVDPECRHSLSPGGIQREYLRLRSGFHLSNRSEEHTSELQSRSDLVCRL